LATVPTQAMRNGDFSGANFVVRDPNTGQPFPGNVIPANRISAESRRVMDFSLPLPNLANLANGFGRYQTAVTPEVTRQRYDARVDHEFGSNNSVFGRYSWQGRKPLDQLENAFYPALGFQ